MIQLPPGYRPLVRSPYARHETVSSGLRWYGRSERNGDVDWIDTATRGAIVSRPGRLDGWAERLGRLLRSAAARRSEAPPPHRPVRALRD